MNRMRVLAVVGILLLMGYVVLSPSSSFAPVPRLMLFLLASGAIAVFLGAEATTRLQLKGPGFTFVTVGTAALAFAILWYLNNALKPDLQVAIYQVRDETGNDVRVDLPSAVALRELPSGRPGFFVAQGNYLVITFPELVAEQELRIRKTSDGPYYTGRVTYTGSRKISLQLGSDLKR